jgi:hypothetical protein
MKQYAPHSKIKRSISLEGMAIFSTERSYVKLQK